MHPAELVSTLSGLLSFPVTPFTSGGEIDESRFTAHVDFQLQAEPSAIFVGCGTGEGFSLDFDEARRLIQLATEVVDGRVPVFAGIGYGTRMAVAQARRAQEAGADGLLVMPPYLSAATQDGLFEHYRQVADAVDLGVIVYQRANAIIDPQTASRLASIDNVIGLKDGLGDLERLARIKAATDGGLALTLGVPTAEIAARGYHAMGVRSYSSAVLNFLPEVAVPFRRAIENGDEDLLDRYLTGFFVPLVELRDQGPGYAVSLIKAAVSLRQGSVGDPRPPLSPPANEHMERLQELIDQGLSLS